MIFSNTVELLVMVMNSVEGSDKLTKLDNFSVSDQASLGDTGG
jgi:hypothetical protein